MLNKIKQKLNTKEIKNFSYKGEKGQGLVEMAIITPLLIFFLLGIFEVGYGIRSYLTLVNLSREITRYAVRPGYLDFSTQETAQAGFEKIKGWAEESVNEQVPLDFDDTTGDTTLIISHMVVDTALPCEDMNNCDCDAFVTDPNYSNNYTLDDLILHPGLPGQGYQAATFGPAATTTGSRETHLDYDALAMELAAQNNKFNCKVIKKGGISSNNNVIVTEIFHDQPQLFGFPFISNPFTDPLPLYTHTSMRLVNGARDYTIANVGPVCVAYPITFGQQIFGNPDNPSAPQSIDAFEGDSPGNFGWITWNPDSSNNNANYVEEELMNPRMSANDFTNVLDPDDHSLSIGDNVSTKPGVANSSGIDAQLQLLVGKEIIVPIYDNNPGSGAGSYYHISHFAKIRVDQICLPRNGSKCDGQNNKQIKATFLGYIDDICAGSPPPPPGPGNNPPVAADDTISTPQNTVVVINILDNDSDPDADTLVIESVSEVSNPFKGTLQITDGSTTITYAPKNNDTGTYTFSYSISDGNGGTDTAMVAVVVTSITGNNVPIAVNDNATTSQDTAVTLNVLSNDGDPDGDPITVASVDTPGNGNVVDNGDGTITYTPNGGFNGSDSFSYTISDGNGGLDTATVTVLVNAPNTPPIAVDDSATTNQNTPVVIDLGSNDSDPDGDSLIFSISTAGSGSVVYNGVGQATYSPNSGFSGSDSFTYSINDGNGGSDIATVTVTVTKSVANNAPIANDDSALTSKNISVTINIIGNDTDSDGDTLIVSSLGTPTKGGSVVDNGDGTITFTPKSGFKNDDDIFTYIISDGHGGTDTATVTITVTNY